MILTTNIKIKTTNKNISYYKTFGFDIKSGDEINITPIQLPPASIIKVLVKCNICDNEKKITMFSYRRNIEKYNYYACSTKCSMDKVKQTNMEKYGETHHAKTKDFVIKMKQTKKDKYGDENYVNIKKQKQTNLKKYGVESYMNTDEFKKMSREIILDKYGTTTPLRNKIIKQKWIDTNLKRYGVEYGLQNDDIKMKISSTKLLNHNNENFNNREKYRETCIDVFGFDNPMKNEDVKDIFYKSFYEKYGEKHPMHVPEFLDKMIKSGIKIHKYDDTDIYYQSTYEKDFLDKYYNLFTITRGKIIRYSYKNIEHIYYSDFYIKELNLIIEIKSSHWYISHKEKNDLKKEYSIRNGYNFLFIIDKNYDIFNKLIKYRTYQSESVCYQYKIKTDIKKDNIIPDLSVKDFNFQYIDSSDKIMCNRVKQFIEEYEWLGKMPNRPTHRFVAMFDGKIGSVIVMSTPNSFSKTMGENTKNIEKLISRGANAYWTPKNLSSSLIMWSIRWMSKNTQFKLFSAYSDTEAKEIGTIYQACNFIYLGQKFGSDYVYFDLDNPNIGWTSGRNFRKISFYKRICKSHNIEWEQNWNKNYTILWDNIPVDISNMLKRISKDKINELVKRKSPKKHKYIYILGENKKEDRLLHKLFYDNNPTYTKIQYPKIR